MVVERQNAYVSPKTVMAYHKHRFFGLFLLLIAGKYPLLLYAIGLSLKQTSRVS